ncbi:hypothetical protein [Paenirhodobacter populi]|uniref:17 kDa surface antigen n=1 Tax=Paenirhodobacter populi TaxID=2306993 RepID=A0A443KB01_9RHOB|nr:hypothetical protein [Sinirhodobacter populi]RWR08673.1 hypothetical protein D2T32_08055 [Sinirhodobacter populi]RWR12794.1 hypothetical protein D2T33_08800 [Sinirhodobacter populi]RWR22608.1 hypothetical protein D2T30_06610 [Sinirhodobacter populi]RWR29938.1 hypothetical protein D2T31_08535 [Sinirhodobacter populi]RWR31708.1 hypothetical protein D2T29_09340 [Sinirhodobacter populi]
MRSIHLILALAAATAVAGCESQGGRALTGAGAGAIIADATDQNIVAGAALGALAGGASCNAGIGGYCR